MKTPFLLKQITLFLILLSLFSCNKSNELDKTEKEALEKIIELSGYSNYASGTRISETQITELPEDISAWKEIKSLDLRQNRLTKLPEKLDLLPKLHYLNIEHNQSTTLPVSLAQNKTDLHIRHFGNPWEWLPRELVDNFEIKNPRFRLPHVSEIR
ncbi:hypothetical protein [Flammeovirga aprica]|uniref:Leucine-rich repeat domain-containing protein n=1 Tax=Flammeovirga aprica JL-4 TaxID=694437 RepID=A0A7X9RWC7_9BACT|nr:hypothetical protein [Flammeovirga aprica]NME69849.1 hypothetical protein [Flammeovirga aprica JL-4]